MIIRQSERVIEFEIDSNELKASNSLSENVSNIFRNLFSSVSSTHDEDELDEEEEDEN